MFENTDLKKHFETSATIKLRSKIIAEWNMNMPDNIFKLGNYRYRPQSSDTRYTTITSVFDQYDSGLFYTNATDADVVVDGGLDDAEMPLTYTSTKDKYKLYYSLEDCVKPFRPRSGINKMLFLSNRYVPNLTTTALENQGTFFTQRPRYYMPTRNDQFKYWTSYRTEKESLVSTNTKERGIANRLVGTSYYIDDAAPFVVYKKRIPSNRLVIKMQTNVGNVSFGEYTTTTGSLSDPFFGESNKTTPKIWKIQKLVNNQWITVQEFNNTSTRSDGSAIIKEDGYVELSYGLKIPASFQNRFIHAETFSSTVLLPNESVDGYAYLIISNATDKGTYYVWNASTKKYDTFIPEYTWFLTDDVLDQNKNFVTNLTSPNSFIEPNTKNIVYREFDYISGIRIVVDTMNKFESTFDLIEFSPRLLVDISNNVMDFNITKSLGDLGSGALPIGQLLASTGTINIFDDNQAFNPYNSNSIVKDYLRKNIKFTFYENIINVNGNDYTIPVKTLYSEGFSEANIDNGTVSLQLRDLYFYFETTPAPRLFITNVSLSYAIALLLDYVGFSNYIYRRNPGEPDPVIPYFFVEPDKSLAEVLNNLAVSTQTSMFFDEYNNFIVMSRNYLMPSSNERAISYTLVGSDTHVKDGVFKNKKLSGNNLPNIKAISSQDKRIYNDGKITYNSRYIDKTYAQLGQENKVGAEDYNWIYKPSLLWQIQDSHDADGNGYALAALALNQDLNGEPPSVVGNIITNNIIDFGESIYLIARHQGYFYANGEVIKYDAVEYNVSGVGNVWISNDAEYKYYKNNLPYNGKIYHTGRVRIFSEPYYEIVNGITRMQNGPVVKHGRAQFGTTITSHYAALPSYWTDINNRKGCEMESQYLFGDTKYSGLTETGSAGVSSDLGKRTTVSSVIKRYLGQNTLTESEILQINKIDPAKNKGLIQSSALIVKGPKFSPTEPKPVNFISYVTKSLEDRFKHFGTRMRIIGAAVGQSQDENNTVSNIVTPLDGTTYYEIPSSSPNQSINITGNSGGIGVLVNSETNNGYYFEIISLDGGNENTSNIIFYKISKDATSSKAIPELLWNGNANILSDNGNFAGSARRYVEANPTVYDLSVEYLDNVLNTNSRRFFLYLNNVLIATVDDTSPLPKYNNVVLFTRGSTKCMFENIYAMAENYSQGGVQEITEPLANIFGNNTVTTDASINKYALSGVFQQTYLSGISASQPNKFKVYFEEFGTIMRECAYFNIRFENAYPALSAKLAVMPDKIKQYIVSGFEANAYGAEFLLFNSTDSLLDLGTEAYNFVNILGIAFTQDNSSELTVDQYFSKRSSFSDPEIKGDTLIYSPIIEKQQYDNIKMSRMIYGKNDFVIESDYIQNADDAESLMNWIINKLMVPKKSVGINIFATPILQLGDIVNIDYKNENGLNWIAPESSKFIVYNIEYNRSNSGPSMTVYLSEV